MTTTEALQRWIGRREDYHLVDAEVFDALRGYWSSLTTCIPASGQIAYMRREDYLRLGELWRYQWAIPQVGVLGLALAWLEVWESFSAGLRRELLLAGRSDLYLAPRFAGEVRERLGGLGAFCEMPLGIRLLGNFRFFCLAFQERRAREGLRLALERWRQGVRR